MRRLRQLFTRRAARGQTLVLFALMSLTLIAMLGLVIDAGVNYAQRRNMQNAADTAALAGTRIISRINTFSYPLTTRGTVWNAVKATAIENGVANNPALIQCQFIDTESDPMNVSCNTEIDGDPNAAIPYPAAGVQVRVSETHTTFFMRALGITTSGTSASSGAQVRAMTFMRTNDVVFAVCGVETATTNPLEPVYSILETADVDDYTLETPPPSPSPWPQKPVATLPNTAIQEGAYYYDWNRRDAANLDLMTVQGGRTFRIYSKDPDPAGKTRPDIAMCDERNSREQDKKANKDANAYWRGAIQQTLDDDIQTNPNGAREPALALNLTLGDQAMDGVAYSSPNCKKSLAEGGGGQSQFCIEHAVNGTLGCKVGQFPSPLPMGQTEPLPTQLGTSGCVMLVPIVDNGYFVTPSGTLSNHPNNRSLIVRAWGAFYVFNVNGNYYGRLIKNYPVHEDGQDTWDWNYVGPITVALTKVK